MFFIIIAQYGFIGKSKNKVNKDSQYLSWMWFLLLARAGFWAVSSSIPVKDFKNQVSYFGHVTLQIHFITVNLLLDNLVEISETGLQVDNVNNGRLCF